MGSTIAEKILARTSGRLAVRAGDEVRARPDFVLAYDFPGYTDTYFKHLREDFGDPALDGPERFGIFIDHFVPVVSEKEEALHQETRAWCRERGVALFEGRGIGHQVAVEEGYATPGAFVVHFDGHVSQLGAYGTLAIGLRRNVLEAFVRPDVALTVPETTRIEFYGALHKGVMARDVLHHIVRSLGPASCRFQVLELAGPSLDRFSDEGLQTIAGLVMFTGALTAIVNPEGARLEAALARARKALEPVRSDTDAVYAATHEVDLDAIEPIVAAPPTPANILSLSEVIGLPVDVGYLGSCASGRIEDLRAAAEVLRGRSIRPGFRLYVVPTSQQIMAQAAREGVLETLVSAGAFISSPTCDYCYGRIATLGAGQRAVSTGTLNVRGRMGNPDSEIYLTNAAVVAASALKGALADPGEYL